MTLAHTAATETLVKPKRPWFSPTTKRRWQNFKANRRGYWSFWLFLILFFLSLIAEFIANDKPIFASYKGEFLVPVMVDYPEKSLAGSLPRLTTNPPSFRTRSTPMAG